MNNKLQKGTHRSIAALPCWLYWRPLIREEKIPLAPVTVPCVDLLLIISRGDWVHCDTGQSPAGISRSPVRINREGIRPLILNHLKL